MEADFLHHNILKIISQRNAWIGLSVLMAVSNIALSIALFLKSERIILVPPHITKTLWVEGGTVSKEYLEEMGLYMAKLLLDLSPTSFSYNHETLLKYATPEAYGALKKQFLEDGDTYTKLQLSTHFKPTEVTANPSKLHVEVKGSLTSYVAGKEIHTSLEVISLQFRLRGAGLLSVSIPFISYGILRQGAAAFVGLAHHLGSAMQSAASGAAAETVSGNLSLGNITMGTQAYQNTSSFQHNTSPAYSASQFRSMGASGVEQSIFADGTQAFNDQAMSRLSVQIMGTENTSYAEQESFNNAWSIARTQNVAATEATEASLQTATNFLSRLGTDQFKGEDYNKNINASEAKSLQNFKHFTNTLQKDLNLNEVQAAEVALGVGIGGSLKFFSAEGKRKFLQHSRTAKSLPRCKSNS
jgi:conjugal transfer pilus assembly protein TraE